MGVDRKLVGKLEGQDIYEVTKFEVIPFMGSTNHLTEAQVSDVCMGGVGGVGGCGLCYL